MTTTGSVGVTKAGLYGTSNKQDPCGWLWNIAICRYSMNVQETLKELTRRYFWDACSTKTKMGSFRTGIDLRQS